MSQTLASLPMLLEIFALLFSNRWMAHWQQQWAEQPRPSEVSPGPGRPAAPAFRKQSKKNPKKKKPKSAPRRFYQRIFSLRVTLWYLIYQRLNFDATLAAVMRNVREGGADRLGPRGRKLSKRLRSTQTSAYNQARQRLPLELLQAALAHLRQGLWKRVGWAPAPRKKPRPAQRVRQLFDGSTLALLRTPELAAAFPPARNQRGASDWCLMRIVVGFCARSGAVLSAMEGAVQRSESRRVGSLDADRTGGGLHPLDWRPELWRVERGGAGRALSTGCAGALDASSGAQALRRPAAAQRRRTAHPVAAQPQRSGRPRHGARGGERTLDLCALAQRREMD